MNQSEMQTCARVQRYFDILQQRHDQERSMDQCGMAIEQEIQYLIREFQKIFNDIVYIDS